MTPRIEWPEGRPFAFTVFDDTDRATLENVRPVYDFLYELGFRTTKSVWMLDPGEPGGDPGLSCQAPPYRDWLLELQGRGFEIGYHGASGGTSDRERTLRALDLFEKTFGRRPATFANHAANRENVYWGQARLTGLWALIYASPLHRRRTRGYKGHVEGDPLFWGDLCRERIEYVRNFTCSGINTLKACPVMPYHDPARPYVNHWFASTEGRNAEAFVGSISERRQDELAAEGGACIMYTHFADGFVRDGRLDGEFQRLMTRLADKGGWLAPAATLLDRILRTRGPHRLTRRERAKLEWKWLFHKFRVGST